MSVTDPGSGSDTVYSEVLEVSATGPSREIDFLMRLARALHGYGMAADRIEEALEQVSEELGVAAQFLVTPTSIVASFGPELAPRTMLLRVRPGVVDLGRLTHLHKLVRAVIDGRLPVGEATREVEALRTERRSYNGWLNVVCAALVSSATATLFDGGWPEIAVASLLGLLIGLLVEAGRRAPRVGVIVPTLAGAVAVLAVQAARHLAFSSGFSIAGVQVADGLAPFIPILAGLIVLVPGLTVTIAVSELATGHLVSGTARFVGSLIAFLQLGFGIAIGGRLAARWFDTVGSSALLPAAAPEPLAWWLVAVSLVIIASGLTVLFQAAPRQWPLVLAACTVSFAGSRLGSVAAGPELGALIGACLVTWLGYLSGRWWQWPSAVAILPGILLLVPGSLGFRSVSSLLANDVVSGIEAGFTMVLLAFSIVTGLLLGNLTVRSRQIF